MSSKEKEKVLEKESVLEEIERDLKNVARTLHSEALTKLVDYLCKELDRLVESLYGEKPLMTVKLEPHTIRCGRYIPDAVIECTYDYRKIILLIEVTSSVSRARIAYEHLSYLSRKISTNDKICCLGIVLLLYDKESPLGFLLTKIRKSLSYYPNEGIVLIQTSMEDIVENFHKISHILSRIIR